MKKARVLILLATFLVTGCAENLGRNVLVFSPITFLLSFGFQYLFLKIWKPFAVGPLTETSDSLSVPKVTLYWKPNLLFLAILLVSSIFSCNTLLSSGDFDLSFIATYLPIFISSYLTIFFAVMRVWQIVDTTKAFTWASIVTMTFFIIPAYMMALSTPGEFELLYGIWTFLWLYPGTGGLNQNGTALIFPGIIPLILFLMVINDRPYRKNTTDRNFEELF